MKNHWWKTAVILLACMERTAQAQSEEQSLMDTYLPIAKIFDSPLFFNVVIWSAVGFVVISLGILIYSKRMEKKAEDWGTGKDSNQLLDLLDSAVPEEARMAFLYLRKNGDEKRANLIIQRLQQQKKEGGVNPSLFYLLEDWQASSAIPTLQAMAKGKSKTALLAQNTLRHFGVELDA